MPVTARPAHIVCLESYRSQRASLRAQLAADPPSAPPESPFERHGRTLTDRQIVHRRRMLTYQRFVVTHAKH
jgi:hypothetical protein